MEADNLTHKYKYIVLRKTAYYYNNTLIKHKYVHMYIRTKPVDYELQATPITFRDK